MAVSEGRSFMDNQNRMARFGTLKSGQHHHFGGDFLYRPSFKISPKISGFAGF
jgi:hypothetical protein